MEFSKEPPLPGPIILAKIGRYPRKQTRSADALDERNKRLGTVAGLLAVFALFACGGLVFAALLHHEMFGLRWLLASVLVTFFFLTIPRRFVQRRLNPLSTDDRPPDEHLVVLVDRLREYTSAGDLGAGPRATGATAWLTQDGVYLEDRKFLAWGLFATYRFEAHSDSCWRIRFRFRAALAPPVVLAFAVTLLALPAGAFVLWAGLVIGLPRYGNRDDMLALLFAAVSLMTCFVYFLMRFIRDRKEHRGTNDRLVLVHRGDFSEDDVRRLLEEHCHEMTTA